MPIPQPDPFVKLVDHRMPDGSRLFIEFPIRHPWSLIHSHLATLDELTITRFVTDDITEGWLDFTFLHHEFTVHDPLDSYLVFVKAPACDIFIQLEILEHLRNLPLPSPPSSAA
ncbi:hypothetical protein FEM03_12625 [Phragmitibacter flavus]|uniref:Uncharacterized protein n=1 Tax=Phragmitibacter flavus TaxID=2576071 RepID=A0A5R8KE58_9BACT|nr:hypothetical protein [Phragmitibacter flavus]TLD70560.1 hypothetical protein FEM03_12625 [Phragmitibacter flavus]